MVALVLWLFCCPCIDDEILSVKETGGDAVTYSPNGDLWVGATLDDPGTLLIPRKLPVVEM